MRKSSKERARSRQPRNFTPAGQVKLVELTKEPSFIAAARKGKQRGAKRAGILYERRVQKYLVERYGYFYVESPWLQFTTYTRDKWRACQPDGLIVDVQAGHVTVIEIKLQHTALAWWQCRQLYLPVVRKLLGPSFSYNCCEIVKWFDPHTIFPETFSLVAEPYRPNTAGFTVHIHSR
jgi:hypothetical protein